VNVVPKIERLTVDKMLELAKTLPNAFMYLPNLDCLNRKLLANFLYTVEFAKLDKLIKDALMASN
jgi:hypothetical protein